MKKLFFALTILLASSFAFIACSDDDDNDKRIEFSQVPATAKTFITDHFAGFDESQVLYTELNKDGTYEVTFTNRIEIDFYSNGVWKEIDMNGNTLPESIAMLVPTSALSYVSTTYPGVQIEEIEKTGVYSEQQGFKIELRGDRDIYFDHLGNVTKDQGNSNGGSQPNVPVADLPQVSQTFLTKYFATQTPTIKREWDKYEATYNKNAANEVEVEFFYLANGGDKNGAFKSIEADGSDAVIRLVMTDIAPTALQYINTNYAGYIIEEFAVTPAYLGEGYKVEIEKGNVEYDVYFNLAGNFIKAIRD